MPPNRETITDNHLELKKKQLLFIEFIKEILLI